MSPKPWATGEAEWRKLIATTCRAIRPRDDATLAGAHCFTVTLVFHLLPMRFEGCDLDNLAKPVLDTVFTIARPQTKDASLTGALVGRNDSTIHRLILEKRIAPDARQAGLDILIEWT